MTKNEGAPEGEKTPGSGSTVERRIVLDVTQVSAQAFLTGIQKTIRAVAERNSDRLTLVRFDHRTGRFIVVEAIPALIKRNRSNKLKNVLRVIGAPYLALSSAVRTQTAELREVPEMLIRAGKALHTWLFSEFRLEDSRGWRHGEVWEAGSGDLFLLLDVPADRRHLQALREIAEGERATFVAYLYDLIPIRQAAVYDPRPAQVREGNFRRYLSLVDKAKSVVFLSHFSRAEYLDYLGRPQSPPRRVRGRVYPALPPLAPRGELPTSSAGGGVSVFGIGALDIRKNFIVVLRALDLLARQGVDITLTLVVGSAKLIDPRISRFLRDHSDALRERVTLLEAVTHDELEALYESSTVVVVPSIAEGFGLPVVEALAHRRPVIASRATSLIELAELFPVTLADPSDAGEWARLLQERSGAPAPEWSVPADFPADWRDFLDRVVAEATPVTR